MSTRDKIEDLEAAIVNQELTVTSLAKLYREAEQQYRDAQDKLSDLRRELAKELKARIR